MNFHHWPEASWFMRLPVRRAFKRAQAVLSVVLFIAWAIGMAAAMVLLGRAP